MASQELYTQEQVDGIVAEATKEATKRATSPLEDKIDYLKYQVEQLRQKLYGRSSEKLVEESGGPQQGQLFEGPVPEPVKEELEEVKAHRRRKPSRPKFPENAEREIIDLELGPSERECGTCGEPMSSIGYDSSTQVHLIPARSLVRETRRHKYACSCKEGGVKSAPLPLRAFPKSQVTDETRAYILTQKFSDHIPYFRQSKILKRQDIVIPDSTMSHYGLEAADVALPVWLSMKAELLEEPYLQVDETTLPTLKTRKGTPGAHRGYLWVYSAPHKSIVLEYQHGRGSEHPAMFLANYSGLLQTDRYEGYNPLRKRDSIVDFACVSHARRKFVEAEKYARAKARPILLLFKEIYAVEREARDDGLDAENRKQLRNEKARPIWANLEQRLLRLAQDVRPATPLGSAVAYTLNHLEALVRYLDYGIVEIDNNLVENSIRPVALGRKNYLFAGSEGGAEAAAILYSLTESCRRLGLDPFRYLCFLFEKLPTVEQPEDYRQLTPQVFASL